MPLLNEKVILSLRRASVQAIQGCEFDFGNGMKPGFIKDEISLGSTRKLGALYQNELTRVYALMTEQEFAKLNCTFKSSFNPITQKPDSFKVPAENFIELFNQSPVLFKLAAKDSIDQVETSKNVSISDSQL